jgi:hypothetical protein
MRTAAEKRTLVHEATSHLVAGESLSRIGDDCSLAEDSLRRWMQQHSKAKLMLAPVLVAPCGGPI